VKKNKYFLAGGLVTLIASLLWLTSFLGDSTEMGSSESLSDDSLRENNQQMAMFYQAPRDALTLKQGLGSKECNEFWGALRSLDLRVQQDEFPDIKQQTQSEKCTEVPVNLKNLHDHFNRMCGKKVDSQQCLVAAYYYRAALTDLMTQGLSISQINDPKILIDKMLANREINPLLSVQAAERLAEIEPRLYEARKAQVLGRLFMASQNKEGNSETDWGALETAIERARELGESDPELLEAELLSNLFKGSNGKGAEEKAREISEDFPREWRGPYYLAWALFQEGRGQEALVALNDALLRDPDNQRIQKAPQ